MLEGRERVHKKLARDHHLVKTLKYGVGTVNEVFPLSNVVKTISSTYDSRPEQAKFEILIPLMRR